MKEGLGGRRRVDGRFERLQARGRIRLARMGYAGGKRFERRIAWIFGSPRSGSTWLLRMLAEHPAVVPINEPLIGSYLGSFVADIPGTDLSKINIEEATIHRLRRDAPGPFFSAKFDDVWPDLLSRFVRGRFLAHAVRFPAAVPLRQSVVVAKEPNGSQAADLLLRALPHSAALFLVRDGRDVVDSELAANLPGSWISQQFGGFRGLDEVERKEFIALSASKWLWRTAIVQEALRAHPGAKHTVRYEHLVSDTVSELQGILDWLGLHMEDEGAARISDDLSFDRIPSDSRGPDQFFRAATPGSWRRNLSSDEQAVVTSILGAKLEELGYEI